MSSWTHRICTECFNFVYADEPRVPYRLKEDVSEDETCHFCHEPIKVSEDGGAIYFRADPNELTCGYLHKEGN